MASFEITIKSARILLQYAKGLPIVANHMHEKITMKGSDLVAMGVKEISGEPIIESKSYMYEPPFITQLFHYKFLCRAWHHRGQQGLTDYLKAVNDIINRKKKDVTEVKSWTDAEILHFVKNIRKVSLFKEWRRHAWLLLLIKLGYCKKYKPQDIKEFTEWKNRVWALLIKPKPSK